MSHYKSRSALISASSLLALLLTGSVVADPSRTESPSVGQTWVSPGESKGFNPQPDPPSDRLRSRASTPGFDPQPDPPVQPASGFQNPGVTKGFNPQPEPPAQANPGYHQPAQGI